MPVANKPEKGDAKGNPAGAYGEDGEKRSCYPRDCLEPDDSIQVFEKPGSHEKGVCQKGQEEV